MNAYVYVSPWATRINLASKRQWLSVPSKRGEYVAGVVVDGKVGWLKAKVWASSVRFEGPIEEPAKVKTFRAADAGTVELIERCLPSFVARGF